MSLENNQEDDKMPGEQGRSHDEGSENQSLQYEKLIDPGNEHSHHFDDNKFESDLVRAPKSNAEKSSPVKENEDHEPGEGENEEADTSGEDG
jgi:hypothetical protein